MSDDKSLSKVERGVLQATEGYVDDLHDRLSTRDLEAVLHGKKDDLISRDLGSKPETHVQNHFIYPLLDAVGLEYTEEPYGGGGGTDTERDIVWPDFELTNISEFTIGENKAPNKIESAHKQVMDYLDRRSIGANYAIATDGLHWRVYRVEQGGDKTVFPIVRDIDLRDLLREVAREKSFIAATTLEEVEIEEEVRKFAELFEVESFERFVTKTAPKELRDSRQRDVEEFYQLYIEYLFGESDEYDEPTCLMDDIQAPHNPPNHDRRKFAVTLMNRLLFIKFLEKKEVVPEGILIDRVKVYEENGDEFTGNFYESQIKPLFYKLFNRDLDERESKHKTGWFTEIPYLNGGLFRPNVKRELDYHVEDRTLPAIIREVIEGERLSDPDGTLDPAILGSVFEMTINHIGGEFGSQKDIGAYYTPGDVTDHITEKAVDPKIKEVVVDAYSEGYDAGVQEKMQTLELSEILRRVEKGEGWFGDSKATRRAYDRLGELRVVDPACGSGHFLTTVMEEIHRVRRGLKRGLNHGEPPSGKENYESKKELALNCIYGVDVDPIGVEIARLRVWLKIVEDDEWEKKFGRLPNIELNIVAGNSLVGLPVKREGQIAADIWDHRLDGLVDLRLQFKDEDDDTEKEEVDDALEELREEFNGEYLKRLTHTYKSEIDSVEEWNSVISSVEGSTLHPTIQSVQIRRSDGGPLSDGEDEQLAGFGFRTYKNSARLDIEKRHNELRSGKSTRSHAEVAEEIAGNLRGLLGEGYVFSEVVRQPVTHDLDNILGKPFHWVAEFPEVASEHGDGSGYSVEFDIIVGNPPYGDIMGEPEKLLTNNYDSANVNDISSLFVERQLRLLGDGGMFGNITTLRLVYQSSIQSLHDFIRKRFSKMDIACFAHRPQQVFPNAIVRTAILTGKLDNPKDKGSIRTSKFLQFNAENRKEVFDHIEYRPVEGLELRERIGGEDRSYEVLPKVGVAEVKSLLELLRDATEESRTIDQAEADGKTDYPVFRRRGGGYWLNAVPENIHGGATTIEDIRFDTELERQTVFLAINSSLFYVYWVAYADFRHLNTGHITRFPLPNLATLREYEDELLEIADELWAALQRVHAGGTRDQFNMPVVKPVIDRADDLLGELYGIDEEIVEYVKEYNSEYGRKRTDDESLADYCVEVSDN